MCVKNNVEVYSSKQRVSSVRMQEENTNSGGEQEKILVAWCKEKQRWPFEDWKKVIIFGREPYCDWK